MDERPEDQRSPPADGDGEQPEGPPRFPPVEESPAPGWPPTGWQPPGYGPPGYGPPGYGPPGYGAPGYPGYGQAGHGAGYPSGRSHWLHPLDVGRAFGTAWRLYRAYWRSLLGATLALMLPASAALALVQAYLVGPRLADWQSRVAEAVRTRSPVPTDIPIAEVLLSIATSLTVSVVALMTMAAVIAIINAAYHGRNLGALDALEDALDRLVPTVGAMLLLFLAVLGVLLVGTILSVLAIGLLAAVLGDDGLAALVGLIGFVGTFAAVVFVGLRWYFAIQVVMCEGGGPVAALRRSWRLVHGSTWRVLGYAILVSLVSIAWTLIIAFVIGLLTLPAILGEIGSGQGGDPFAPVVLSPNLTFVTTFVPALLALPILPYVTAVLTLLYFDLRWQKGESMADQPTTTEATAPLGG